MRGKWAFRAGALLAVGAVALHQGVYALGNAGTSLGGHGHGYLPLFTALAAVLLLSACAGFARTLWRAAHGHGGDPAPPGFLTISAAAVAALLAVFGLQEWIESWAAPDHPAGPAHIAAHVGWIGLALAIVLGALIGALLRGAHSATYLLVKRHASLRRPRPAASRGLPLPGPELPRLSVLAVHRAGRAPPLLPA